MIDSFSKENRWLSNFWKAEIEYSGFKFVSVEHGYQSLKFASTPLFSEAYIITDPYAIKKYANRNKKHIAPLFNDIKVGLMQDLVMAKFFQNEDLAKLLIATGNQELIEGNTWNDKFWGVCNGEGLNWLGKILMKVRDELKDELNNC